MRLHLLAATILMWCGVSPARADGLFQVQGTFQSGATLSGYLTTYSAGNPINEGLVSSAYLVVTQGITTKIFNDAFSGSVSAINDRNVLFSTAVGMYYASPDFLDLSFPFPNLLGVASTYICSITKPCFYVGVPVTSGEALDISSTQYVFTDILESGTVTAVTPEPSGMTLIATGMLAIVALRRKRPATIGLS